MTTKRSVLRPIQITPGVEPSTDNTALATPHYTASKAIRFDNGVPVKIGGNERFDFDRNAAISGTARSVYSVQIGTAIQTVIGTHEKLYSLQGTLLTNITPLKTSTIAVANALATHYGTLANNPITTVLGSTTLTVADTDAPRYQAGDTVTLSGAAAVGGVPNTDINAAHVIRSVGATSLTIRVATAATSAATGGGASVLRRDGLIRITKATHGQSNGDRVKVLVAATTGGITDVQINLEHIIRNVASGTFDIMTAGTATSSVSGGGGASTTYQEEIDPGQLDESLGQGYGVGKYGVGLYGVSKMSTAGRFYPRIWFFDHFGDDIMMTPGNQTGVFTWDGDENVAPVLLTNAPAAVNYAFVSNSIVVTLGAGGVPNKILASDQGAPTVWTGSSTNKVFEDNIEDAGRFISHVPVGGIDLLFTEDQTRTFRFIDFPLIWEIQMLDPSVGIIGPMARCSAKGMAFWVGKKNFYMWRGGNVEIIPANTQPQSTILNFIFQNLNESQKSKVFAWYNVLFDEVWFHIPSAESNEPDTVARVSLQDFTWSPDEMERTAAEYPNNLLTNPRLMNVGNLYIHETGTDDDDAPLTWNLVSNTRTGGDGSTTTVVGLVPDSSHEGNITVNVTARQYPQSSTPSYNKTFPVTPTTQRIATQANGHVWQYTWAGNALGQRFLMGTWQEYVQKGSRQ